ncbi:hypothetical protein BH11ARM1_BH11ARM1_16310 [soil metagenome]
MSGNAKPLSVAASIVTAASVMAQASWKYATTIPTGDWQAVNYDSSDWKAGMAGFGTDGTPGGTIRTKWSTDDIWIRRTFELNAGDKDGLKLYLHHDEDAEVYINGVLAVKGGGFVASTALRISPPRHLRP